MDAQKVRDQMLTIEGYKGALMWMLDQMAREEAALKEKEQAPVEPEKSVS